RGGAGGLGGRGGGAVADDDRRSGRRSGDAVLRVRGSQERRSPTADERQDEDHHRREDGPQDSDAFHGRSPPGPLRRLAPLRAASCPNLTRASAADQPERASERPVRPRTGGKTG